jgi:hypothetical protein
MRRFTEFDRFVSADFGVEAPGVKKGRALVG